MRRLRSQMISVRDLLRKMRSHAVASVVSAVALATVGCGFVVFTAVDGIETASYETVYEGDMVTQMTASFSREEMLSHLTRMQDALESLYADVSESAEAVGRIENTLSETELDTEEMFADAAKSFSSLYERMDYSFHRISTLRETLLADSWDAGRYDEVMAELLQIELSLTEMNDLYVTTSRDVQDITSQLAMSVDVDLTAVMGSLTMLDENLSGNTRHIGVLTDQMQHSNDSLSSLSGQMKDSSDLLSVLVGEVQRSNAQIEELGKELRKTREEIDVLKGMLGEIGITQEQISSAVSQSETRMENEYATLRSMVETNTGNITTLSNRLPFSFGVDSDGDYGYIKDGADAVIPFRRPGLKTGERVAVAHIHDGASNTAGVCYGEGVTTTTTQGCPYSYRWGTNSYQYCNSCRLWQWALPATCSATGGAHNTVTKQLVNCPVHHRDFPPGDTCPYSQTVTATVHPLICDCVSCGSLYIRNNNTRTGFWSGTLSVVIEGEDASMEGFSYAWSCADGGVISGSAEEETVVCAHNGLYRCAVTVTDMKSGKQSTANLEYRVTNLAK